jgi:hypothetical protein
MRRALAGSPPAGSSRLHQTVWLMPLLALSVGCSLTRALPPDGAPRPAPEASRHSDVATYLGVLETMASGAPDVQAATLASARAAWQLNGTVRDGLAYAIALGAPGHLESNPIDAGRLLSTLLARVQPDALTGDVRRLAEALRQEYAARTALYAEIARQKDAAARELRDSALLSEARIEDLSADVARLRRERDEARSKLQAITDMERQLIENDPDPARTEGQP